MNAKPGTGRQRSRFLRAIAGAGTLATVGAGIWIVLLLVALVGPHVYRVNPFAIVYKPRTPPFVTMAVPLGTDYLGRDILAGLVHGALVTLEVGLGAALFTVLIGVSVGAFAGFYGGRLETLLMRITEFFQVLPPLLLAMVLILVLSPSTLTVIAAIGATSWPPIARVTRAEILSIKTRDFVTASRAVGATDAHLIWRVILPNVFPSIIVLSTLLVGTAVLFQAALSFLGLTDQNVMSWGLMIGQSRDYIFSTWWAVTLPGIMIILAVLGIGFLGEGLSDHITQRGHRP